MNVLGLCITTARRQRAQQAQLAALKKIGAAERARHDKQEALSAREIAILVDQTRQLYTRLMQATGGLGGKGKRRART